MHCTLSSYKASRAPTHHTLNEVEATQCQQCGYKSKVGQMQMQVRQSFRHQWTLPRPEVTSTLWLSRCPRIAPITSTCSGKLSSSSWFGQPSSARIQTQSASAAGCPSAQRPLRQSQMEGGNLQGVKVGALPQDLPDLRVRQAPGGVAAPVVQDLGHALQAQQRAHLAQHRKLVPDRALRDLHQRYGI